MIFKTKNIPLSLSKSHLLKPVTRGEIDSFKDNLTMFFNKINANQNASEEHYKNILIEFLKDAFYKGSNEVNTKDRIDLAIYNGKTASDSVGVICEVKKPLNTGEMCSSATPNAKALQELVLYFMRERSVGNLEVKNLIATNLQDFFIFDSKDFDKLFFQNNSFKKQYESWNNGDYSNIRTEAFYNEIAKPYLEKIEEIECTHFNINSFQKCLSKDDNQSLIDLFKILSPIHLLNQSFANDSNSLNNDFYSELLYIIGLEEVKDGGKLIIRRKEKDRQAGSLIENTINILQTEESLYKIKDLKSFGDNKDEQLFNIALELSLTWINRILFLKLLEGRLINYHNNDLEYKFLSPETIVDYDEIYKLFHQVLAKNYNERSDQINKKFSKIPYLNSSLFEISELEDSTIKINSLGDNEDINLFSKTILKEDKLNNIKLKPLNYLLKFLNSFNFANEGKQEIVEESKTIINASVLGKVFEKINGYKDGSIFTPGFITMYMSRQALRLAVVQKFNDYFKETDYPEVNEFDELYNKIARIEISKSNEIVNSLKICDPAVGSGHFLVSALNEMIVIKHKLGILVDKNNRLLRDYDIEIDNDELIITDHNGIFNYNYKNTESQRIQETIFHEKQTIIENCLFGVDINPNSVKICRLRLWIELLKSAYYKDTLGDQNTPLNQTAGDNQKNTPLTPLKRGTELETLPNIDINIKCGNSLLSRFALDSDLSKALKSIKYDINAYRGFVQSYKNEKNREVKRGLQNIIDSIKSDFRTEISKNDPKILKLNKLTGELHELNQSALFELNDKEKKAQTNKKDKLEKEITQISNEIEEIKSNAIYRNAFEWRFEFPEVLNDNGDFVGFDVVIGNPPYIQLQSMGKDVEYYSNFSTFSKTGDIYSLFYEKGNAIIKNSGYLAFITSNKWMRANYGLTTRKYLIQNTNPLIIIDFGMLLVFENATVLTNIMILSKNIFRNSIKACRMPNEFDLKSDLLNYFESNYSEIFIDHNAWVINSKIIYQIKNKVEEKGIILKLWDIKINYGIKTGLNEAFIIDEKVKDELVNEDVKSLDFIKPILRGQDIKAWKPEFSDLWIIFIPKGFTIKKNLSKENQNYLAESTLQYGSKDSVNENPIIVAEPTPRYGNMELDEAWIWFSDHYPAISKYLYQFKTKAKFRQDQGDFWWEQRACTYFDEFSKPKIIYPNMTKFLPFVYDEKGFITNQKCFIITSNIVNLKYLTSFLNSKLFKFCFKDDFPELLGETFELSKVFFEQIPIKEISSEEQQSFIDLVDIILAKKEHASTGSATDTTAEEKAIDQLVYQLYDLTEEEIRIVEGE